MTEQINEHIFRIGVPLPKNPLKETNAYLIRSEGKELLIDTGFRRPECREALRAGLKELWVDTDHLDILTTHMHSDHSGLAREFAGMDRHIYMSRRDLNYLTENFFTGKHTEKMRNRFRMEGFPESILDSIANGTPSVLYSMEETDDRFVPLDNGSEIRVGALHLETIITPGHTPGNAMFWLREEGIMFTGDQILFDITPNITAWPDTNDSLQDYLDSLEHIKNFPVKLALPGHRKPGNYHKRILELQQHHRNRLAEVFHIVSRESGLSAYEITSRMSWNVRCSGWDDFPDRQRWYAVGECLAHLDYLCHHCMIERECSSGKITYCVRSGDSANLVCECENQ